MKTTKRNRVDFLDNQDDFTVALLGSLGFSTRFILKKTKLSPCQVTYRLNKAGIKRIDYRDGTSSSAATVLKSVRQSLTEDLTHRFEGAGYGS